MPALIALGLLCLDALLLFFGGLILSALWGWFMVPVLGLPAISLMQAIGIALIASLLTHQYIEMDWDEDLGEKITKMYIFKVLHLVFIFIIGLIVHFFV